MKKEVEEKKEIFWHAISSDKAIEKLKSKSNGLSDEEAAERIKIYGKNEIRKIRRLEPLRILFEQFKSFFVILLIIAAVISGFVAHWVDMYVILGIVVLNAGIGFFQNYKAEKTILALKGMLVTKTKIIRSGILKEIPASEIVPGDILMLQEGDRIVADSRIIETHDLQTNEAVLTGESMPINKTVMKIELEVPIHERTNMLYKGTSIVRGSCKALVVATGMNTEFGKIATMVQKARAEKTPLQVKIDNFALKLGLIIIGLALVITILGLAFGLDKLQVFLTSVSLAVSAVPEGLPAVLTIALALAVQRMYKQKSLIRTLPSAETLGRVTVICTDKTGTLTEEKMSVTDLYFDNKIVKTSNISKKNNGTNKALELLFKINCLCNNARIEKIDEKEIIIGDPTEAALLYLASKFDFDKKTLTEKEPRIKEFAFTSKRKMMSIVRKYDKSFVSYVKGAPDVILEKCTREVIGNSSLRLTSKRRKELFKVYKEMAAQGLRVLGFAYKPSEKITQKDAESELIFVGFQGMLDPPRKEVKGAIKACQEAGIKVKMITGDSALTAKAIASQIGLAGKSIEGKEIEKMSDSELIKIIKETTIFARTTPEQKLRIVNLLKKEKEIVAVTGDGVNDAPALKRADIGIAMGIRGTDVARETSNIILLDDNFASIVKAVEEGRIVYDNTKKFTKFLLGVNFSEMILILYSILLRLPLPLLPLHILWMNLITDSIPALALSAEKGEDVMKRKPQKEESILQGIILFIITAGFLAFIIYLAIFYFGLSHFDIDKTRTMVLTTSILFQMFFVFVCRSKKPIQKIGILSNRWLILAVSASIILHLIFMYTSLGSLIYIVPLNLKDWFIVLSLAISGLLIFEIGKNIKYRKIKQL